MTSGVIILPRVKEVAREIATHIQTNKVQKEYVARVQGEFPG
jgi:23S rRNA-/tRNA-specific pseudouridylate synthase